MGLAVVGVACGPSAASARRDAPVESRWITDAVPRHEAIVGRHGDGRLMRVLTSANRLIEIDLHARRVAATALRNVGEDEKVSGLGQAEDGSLWTLAGWTSLVRLGQDGSVVEKRGLSRQMSGLHSAFGRLVYQPLDFTGGAPALVVNSRTEAGSFIPWGTLKVHGGPELGPVRLAQSLASCGVVVAGRIPCWLSNASTVELMDASGTAMQIRIPELAPWTSSDPDAFARNPHRVIRDVWLESPSVMWLLVRPASSDQPDRAGERGLWRVNSRGEVTARHVMVGRARMILGVQPGRVVVLTSEGHVVAEEV